MVPDSAEGERAHDLTDDSPGDDSPGKLRPRYWLVVAVAAIGGYFFFDELMTSWSSPSASSPLADVSDPAGHAFAAIHEAANDPGKLDEALQLLGEALRRDPLSEAALFGLGWAHQQGGDLDTAERAYRAAIGVMTTNDRIDVIEGHTHTNLGFLLRDRDKASAAQLEFDYSTLGTGENTPPSPEEVGANRVVYEIANALLKLENDPQIESQVLERTRAAFVSDDKRAALDALLRAAQSSPAQENP